MVCQHCGAALLAGARFCSQCGTPVVPVSSRRGFIPEDIAERAERPNALFFADVVDSYVSNPRFIRRDWLSEEVKEQLKDPSCRFVLLTAEPGAGKSAFMAQLAHDHPDWPRYFIRRDQRSFLADVGTHSFLLRLGFQLAALFPEFFTPENLKIAVEQRLGTVEGKVVGAEIEKIVASPFYKKVIRIQQHVENIKGRVVGLG